MSSVDESYPPIINYMKSSDITSDVTLVIKSASMEIIKNLRENTSENSPVLFFEQSDKSLVLNRTNTEWLRTKFGASKNWIGKNITLYLEDTTFGGRKVKGIRLK